MKIILSLFTFILLFTGCSGGDAKTDGTSVIGSAYDKRAVLYTNETRQIELNIDVDDSYRIVSSTERAVSGTVEHSIEYISNSTKPLLILKGVSPGEEVVKAVSTSPSGERKEVRVSVLVVENENHSDAIGGDSIDVNGTVPDDGNVDNGGGGGDTPPNIEPGGQAIFDRAACSYTADFKRVTDDWSTIEGAFGPDGGGYIRSIITNADHNSEVTLFYPVVTVSEPARYMSLGRYSYKTKEGITIIYDLEVAVDMVGQKEYVYVKSNNYCLRMKVPTSQFTPPDKTVTWVVGIY